MTREHAKNQLPNIIAFANGEDVQARTSSNEWLSMTQLNFEGPLDQYRIAPKLRKVWVNEYPNGLALHCFPRREDADRADSNNTRLACYELELPPLP